MFMQFNNVFIERSSSDTERLLSTVICDHADWFANPDIILNVFIVWCYLSHSFHAGTFNIFGIFAVISQSSWTVLPSHRLISSSVPSGAVCIPVFLPLTVLFLICVSQSPEASILQWPPCLPSADQLWDPLAPILLLGWIGLHALLYLLPLGKVWNVYKMATWFWSVT